MPTDPRLGVQFVATPAPGTRVVLVKPGDALLIGNVGRIPADVADQVRSVLALVGLERVVMFERDIDVSALTSDPVEG